MIYEPTNWKTGDIVSSARLNKIENSIASLDALIINEEERVDGDPDIYVPYLILDKTAGEIYDAFTSGRKCIVKSVDDEYDLANYLVMAELATDSSSDDELYKFMTNLGGETIMMYYATSADDYPSSVEPEPTQIEEGP